MTTLDAFAAMHRSLLATLGEPVTVVRGDGDPVALRAFVDQAIQEVGQRARVYGSKRVLAMTVADWQPIKGDVFTVRGREGKVEEVMQDDGLIVTVVLHG